MKKYLTVFTILVVLSMFVMYSNRPVNSQSANLQNQNNPIDSGNCIADQTDNSSQLDNNSIETTSMSGDSDMSDLELPPLPEMPHYEPQQDIDSLLSQMNKEVKTCIYLCDVEGLRKIQEKLNNIQTQVDNYEFDLLKYKLLVLTGQYRSAKDFQDVMKKKYSMAFIPWPFTGNLFDTCNQLDYILVLQPNQTEIKICYLVSLMDVSQVGTIDLILDLFRRLDNEERKKLDPITHANCLLLQGNRELAYECLKKYIHEIQLNPVALKTQDDDKKIYEQLNMPPSTEKEKYLYYLESFYSVCLSLNKFNEAKKVLEELRSINPIDKYRYSIFEIYYYVYQNDITKARYLLNELKTFENEASYKLALAVLCVHVGNCTKADALIKDLLYEDNGRYLFFALSLRIEILIKEDKIELAESLCHSISFRAPTFASVCNYLMIDYLKCRLTEIRSGNITTTRNWGVFPIIDKNIMMVKLPRPEEDYDFKETKRQPNVEK